MDIILRPGSMMFEGKHVGAKVNCGIFLSTKSGVVRNASWVISNMAASTKASFYDC